MAKQATLSDGTTVIQTNDGTIYFTRPNSNILLTKEGVDTGLRSGGLPKPEPEPFAAEEALPMVGGLAGGFLPIPTPIGVGLGAALGQVGTQTIRVARGKPAVPVPPVTPTTQRGIELARRRAEISPLTAPLVAGAEFGGGELVGQQFLNLPFRALGGAFKGATTPEMIQAIRGAEEMGVNLPLAARTGSKVIRGVSRFTGALPLGGGIQKEVSQAEEALRRAATRFSSKYRPIISEEERVFTESEAARMSSFEKEKQALNKTVSKARQDFDTITTDFQNEFGGRISREQAGKRIQESFNKVLEQKNKISDKYYAELEQKAGNVPFTKTSDTKEYIEKVFKRLGLGVEMPEGVPTEILREQGELGYTTGRLVSRRLETVNPLDWRKAQAVLLDLEKPDLTFSDGNIMKNMADKIADYESTKASGLGAFWKGVGGALRKDLDRTAEEGGFKTKSDQAREMYKDFIGFLESPAIKSVELKEKSPEGLVDAIVNYNSPTKVRTVMNEFGDDGKNALRGGFVSKLFDNAKGSPDLLKKQIEKYTLETMKEVFGNTESIYKIRDGATLLKNMENFQKDFPTDFKPAKFESKLKNFFEDTFDKSLVYDVPEGRLSISKISENLNKYKTEEIKRIFGDDYKMVENIRDVSNALSKVSEKVGGDKWISTIGYFGYLHSLISWHPYNAVAEALTTTGMSKLLRSEGFKKAVTEGVIPSIPKTRFGVRAVSQLGVGGLRREGILPTDIPLGQEENQ